VEVGVRESGGGREVALVDVAAEEEAAAAA